MEYKFDAPIHHPQDLDNPELWHPDPDKEPPTLSGCFGQLLGILLAMLLLWLLGTSLPQRPETNQPEPIPTTI